MKKLFLVMMIATLSATAQQVSKNAGNAVGVSKELETKVSTYCDLVKSYAAKQNVDKAKIATLSKEINCALTENQGKQLDVNFAKNREKACGATKYPTSSSISDNVFSRYKESYTTFTRLDAQK